MTTGYPIVFERESSGAVSAYVPGLPVYAAADSLDEAERQLCELLGLFLADRRAHGLPVPDADTVIKVARVTTSARGTDVTIVSPAALIGRHRSPRKAAAARRNGLRGGRPRRVTPSQ